MTTTKAVGTAEEFEALDRPGFEQTLKDLPIAIIGSALGYAVGNAAARHVLQRYGAPGAPDWVRHVPTAVGAAQAIAVPLLQSKINQILKQRRAAAREAK
jgi:hypothetical protein